jgi:hypothetical protein
MAQMDNDRSILVLRLRLAEFSGATTDALSATPQGDSDESPVSLSFEAPLVPHHF